MSKNKFNTYPKPASYFVIVPVTGRIKTLVHRERTARYSLILPRSFVVRHKFYRNGRKVAGLRDSERR